MNFFHFENYLLWSMSKRIFVERACQSIIFSREKAQAVDNELDDELQVWFFNFNLSAHI